MQHSSKTTKCPCFGQTETEIKSWMKANVSVGSIVAVRHTQARFLQYAKATVVRVGKGRFEVDTLGPGNLSSSGKTFYYSGKNCWHPVGQTRLVIPTEQVLNACGEPGDLRMYSCETTV